MERQNPFYPMDPGPLPPSGGKPLEVCLLRGRAIESRHRVHVMVREATASGGIVHSWGNPDLAFFPRSAVKWMQAAAWVSKGMDRQVSHEELALACSSHHGEAMHTQLVNAWLTRLGLSEEDLECGTHEPYHRPTARALVREDKAACQLHNNCSGKHAGLLTACQAQGWATLGYSSYDHPVQQSLRETLGQFLDLDLGRLPWGIDGCGIPTYALPLSALALGMARLAQPEELPADLGAAVDLLNGAVAARPELVGGSHSFCSQVVAETEGRVFAKTGAEGVYGGWIPAAGLGIVLKAEDGSTRAAEMAMASVLRELGHPLAFFSPLVRRWTGEVVGQLICA